MLKSDFELTGFLPDFLRPVPNFVDLTLDEVNLLWDKI